MFSRIAVIVAALVVFVAANSGVSHSCNSGTTYCCNTVQNADSANGALLLSLVGLAAKDVTGQVGGIVVRSPSSALLATLALSSLYAATTMTSLTLALLDGLVATGCTPLNANV